jgi:ankyrin repeat protein
MGETALHLAVELTETEVVEVLIDAKGVDINQQDISGFTPLHIAVFKSARLLSREKVVRLLAQHKDIDFTKKDRRGWTPLRLAKDNFFLRNFVDILKENGAQS